MLQQKLTIQALRTLNREELHVFGRSFRKRNKQQPILIKLYNYLERWHPHYTSRNCTTDYLIRKVVVAYSQKEDKLPRNEQNDYTRLRHLMSIIKKQLFEYLTQQMLSDNKHIEDFLLLEFFKDRGSSALYEKQLKKCSNRMENQAVYWHSYFDLLLSESTYFDSHEYKHDKQHTLETVIEKSTYFYEQKLLRCYVELLFAQKITSYQLEEEQLSEIERFITHFAPKNTTDELYFKLLKLIHYDKQELFVHLFNLAKKATHQGDIIAHLINYTVQKLRLGEKAYEKYIYELTKLQIELEMEMHYGLISSLRYLNAIVSFTTLGMWEEVNKFSEQFAEFLPLEEKEGILKLCQAQIHFERSEYGKVIELMHSEKLPNPFCMVNSQLILLASYIEVYGADEENQPFITARIAQLMEFSKHPLFAVGLKTGIGNFCRAMHFLLKSELEKIQLLLDADEPMLKRTWITKRLEKR